MAGFEVTTEAQFLQMWSEAANELHGGFDHDLLISSFVLGEPLAVVVAL